MHALASCNIGTVAWGDLPRICQLVLGSCINKQSGKCARALDHMRLGVSATPAALLGFHELMRLVALVLNQLLP